MNIEYLFVSPRSDTLTIICNRNTIQISLNGAGTIRLENNYKAFTKYVTLQSFSSYNITDNFDYVPTINIMELKIDTNVKKYIANNDYSIKRVNPINTPPMWEVAEGEVCKDKGVLGSNQSRDILTIISLCEGDQSDS